jgi:hypothetical protein
MKKRGRSCRRARTARSTAARDATARSTHSSHRIVKDSGHMIPIRAPAAVVDAVRDIVDRRI